MSVFLVPYHLDERLDELDVPLAADRIIHPGLVGDTVTQRMLGLNAAVAEEVAVAAADRVIVLTGDCTTAAGVFAGLQRGGVDPAVVWFDAHGDLHTPATSMSGYLGGMALRNLLDDGDPTFADHLGARRLPATRALLVDGRDLDPPEAEYLATGAVRRVPVATVTGDPATLPAGPLYLHVDLDVVDGSAIPGLRYPTPDGPDVVTVADAMAAVLATGRVVAVTLACTWYPGHRAAESVDALVRRLL